MTRLRTRRRKPRTTLWEGVVTEVCGDGFTARLLRVQPPWDMELVAEFDLDKLPAAREGTIFRIHAWAKGKKRRTVIRERVLPPLTDADLAEGAAWADAAAMTWLVDGPTTPESLNGEVGQ